MIKIKKIENLLSVVKNLFAKNQDVSESSGSISSFLARLTKASKNLEKNIKPEPAPIRKRSQAQPQPKRNTITGQFVAVPRGPSYIIKDGKKIYIANKNTRNAVHGDLLEVEVKGDDPNGNIVHRVLQRKKLVYSGIIKKKAKDLFFTPDDSRVGLKIYVLEEDLGGARIGEKVLARLSRYKKNALKAKVIEVLGTPGEHETEMRAIIADLGFSEKFPKTVEKVVASLPETASPEEIRRREDFRNTLTFTIDPTDAKDFDDALSYKKLPDGDIEIGVHIADVTHYVREDSCLDIEARKRGTSVYLVDRVVSMLPERLANDLCSLKPNVDRLTFSVVFKMSKDGQIKDFRITKGVIHSDIRFTYEEVQEILEAKKGRHYEELSTLNHIAKKLGQDRKTKGSVTFLSQEVKFILDENKAPVDVVIKVQKDAHRLIEEFMLLANKTVAEKISKVGARAKSRLFVFRAHESPNKMDIKRFANFIKGFGYKLNTKNNEATRHSLNTIMEEVKDKDEEYIVSQLMLRAMSKAYYNTEVKSHYGLAFDYYTHFTSPIRRYPDIMAHRLLFYYLQNRTPKNLDKYPEMCAHASLMEKKAVAAERGSIKFKQVEFLKNNVGDVFLGIISGVTEWGLYIELVDNKCEGMINLRRLQSGKYKLTEDKTGVTDTYTKHTLRIGDKVTVKLTNVDTIKKHIDLELCS